MYTYSYHVQVHDGQHKKYKNMEHKLLVSLRECRPFMFIQCIQKKKLFLIIFLFNFCCPEFGYLQRSIFLLLFCFGFDCRTVKYVYVYGMLLDLHAYLGQKHYTRVDLFASEEQTIREQMTKQWVCAGFRWSFVCLVKYTG